MFERPKIRRRENSIIERRRRRRRRIAVIGLSLDRRKIKRRENSIIERRRRRRRVAVIGSSLNKVYQNGRTGRNISSDIAKKNVRPPQLPPITYSLLIDIRISSSVEPGCCVRMCLFALSSRIPKPPAGPLGSQSQSWGQ